MDNMEKENIFELIHTQYQKLKNERDELQRIVDENKIEIQKLRKENKAVNDNSFMLLKECALYKEEIEKLKDENEKLNLVIDTSKEWLELCQDNDGNIKNYDLRQLDTRIRPERYNNA